MEKLVIGSFKLIREETELALLHGLLVACVKGTRVLSFHIFLSLARDQDLAENNLYTLKTRVSTFLKNHIKFAEALKTAVSISSILLMAINVAPALFRMATHPREDRHHML
ncbi:hypothetical protein Zmor_024815 [Zophobas morio]|jgi:hypothetical protein|uniref:Uncharacterized protein n=1 Tax=Zophobas morio TaxID=2755281 RepID=A0AA38HNT0_9CUCU|nr:hypothetical protein Zmor_024815 [Zophobas morio]